MARSEFLGLRHEAADYGWLSPDCRVGQHNACPYPHPGQCSCQMHSTASVEDRPQIEEPDNDWMLEVTAEKETAECTECDGTGLSNEVDPETYLSLPCEVCGGDGYTSNPKFGSVTADKPSAAERALYPDDEDDEDDEDRPGNYVDSVLQHYREHFNKGKEKQSADFVVKPSWCPVCSQYMSTGQAHDEPKHAEDRRRREQARSMQGLASKHTPDDWSFQQLKDHIADAHGWDAFGDPAASDPLVPLVQMHDGLHGGFPVDHNHKTSSVQGDIVTVLNHVGDPLPTKGGGPLPHTVVSFDDSSVTVKDPRSGRQFIVPSDRVLPYDPNEGRTQRLFSSDQGEGCPACGGEIGEDRESEYPWCQDCGRQWVEVPIKNPRPGGPRTEWEPAHGYREGHTKQAYIDEDDEQPLQIVPGHEGHACRGTGWIVTHGGQVDHPHDSWPCREGGAKVAAPAGVFEGFDPADPEIQPREGEPLFIPGGNKKLGSQKAVGRANTIIHTDLPNRLSCPGASDWCAGNEEKGIDPMCYVDNYSFRPNVGKRYMRMFNYWRRSPEKYEAQINSEITAHKTARATICQGCSKTQRSHDHGHPATQGHDFKPGHLTVRINTSGDLESNKHVDMWQRTADRHPDVTFFGYTRSHTIPKMREGLTRLGATPNFNLALSTDPSMGDPDMDMTHFQQARAIEPHEIEKYEDEGYKVCMAGENIGGGVMGKSPNGKDNCSDCGLCFNKKWVRNGRKLAFVNHANKVLATTRHLLSPLRRKKEKERAQTQTQTPDLIQLQRKPMAPEDMPPAIRLRDQMKSRSHTIPHKHKDGDPKAEEEEIEKESSVEEPENLTEHIAEDHPDIVHVLGSGREAAEHRHEHVVDPFVDHRHPKGSRFAKGIDVDDQGRHRVYKTIHRDKANTEEEAKQIAMDRVIAQGGVDPVHEAVGKNGLGHWEVVIRARPPAKTTEAVMAKGSVQKEAVNYLLDGTAVYNGFDVLGAEDDVETVAERTPFADRAAIEAAIKNGGPEEVEEDDEPVEYATFAQPSYMYEPDDEEMDPLFL